MPEKGQRKEIRFQLTDGPLKTQCHECISHTSDTMGYPIIRISGKLKSISRHIYEDRFGKIEDGIVVRHKSDNRKCINIDHLELGTQKDNVHDSIKRKRHKNVYPSKLSINDIFEIRNMLIMGMKQSIIANKFKIDTSCISRIKTGNTYSWI